MKQIDQILSQKFNKLFETPQKKQKQQKKHEEIPAAILDFEQQHKFDLGSSPRYLGSTEINVRPEASIRNLCSSQSQKKNESPQMIKIQQNKHTSTPQRYFRFRESQRFFQEKYGDLSERKNLVKCYQDLIKNIMKGNHQIMIPIPELFFPYHEEDENLYSQLVTFNLNLKNSRKLVYDQQKHTLISVYDCLGCNSSYLNPSALGGHLSRCLKKEEHYEKLKNYYEGCGIIQEESEEIQKKSFQFDVSSQKISETPKKQKVFKQVDKQNPYFFQSSESKSVQKNQIDEEKHYFEQQVQIERKKDQKKEFKEEIKMETKTLKKIIKMVKTPKKNKRKNKKIYKLTKKK